MRVPLVVAAAVVWALCLLGGGAAAQDAPTTTPYASADEKFAVPLPSDWTAHVEAADVSKLTVTAKVPGCAQGVLFEVFHVPGMRNERGQAYSERDWKTEEHKPAERAEVRLAPLPHVVLKVRTRGADYWHAWIFRIIERNGFTLHVECAPQDWDAVAPAAFAAAKGLVAKVEEWPARPDGYRAQVKDGYEYLVHPAVKDKEVDAVHKLLMEQEAAWTRVFGPLPKPESNRPVVVVHAKKEDAAKLSADAAKAPYGTKAVELEGRLYTVPPPKGSPEYVGEFGQQVVGWYQYQAFGSALPNWRYQMDRSVAWMEGMTGKPLPALGDKLFDSLPKRLEPFDKLTPLKDVNDGQRVQLFVYGAVFRAGAKPWKDAWAAYCLDLAATGDPETAQTKHLFALDQTKLRQAAEQFAAKEFKPVKGR